MEVRSTVSESVSIVRLSMALVVLLGVKGWSVYGFRGATVVWRGGPGE